MTESPSCPFCTLINIYVYVYNYAYTYVYIYCIYIYKYDQDGRASHITQSHPLGEKRHIRPMWGFPKRGVPPVIIHVGFSLVNHPFWSFPMGKPMVFPWFSYGLGYPLETFQGDEEFVRRITLDARLCLEHAHPNPSDSTGDEMRVEDITW